MEEHYTKNTQRQTFRADQSDSDWILSDSSLVFHKDSADSVLWQGCYHRHRNVTCSEVVCCDFLVDIVLTIIKKNHYHHIEKLGQTSQLSLLEVCDVIGVETTYRVGAVPAPQTPQHTRLLGTDVVEGHNPSESSGCSPAPGRRVSLSCSHFLHVWEGKSCGEQQTGFTPLSATSPCSCTSSHTPTHTRLCCSLLVIGRIHTDADTQPMKLVQLLVRHGPKH